MCKQTYTFYCLQFNILNQNSTLFEVMFKPLCYYSRLFNFLLPQISEVKTFPWTEGTEQEEKGMTEDVMVGWHHWLDGPEFEQTPGVGMDREAWRAVVHGVAKSQTGLSNWTELNWPISTYLCMYVSSIFGSIYLCVTIYPYSHL